MCADATRTSAAIRKVDEDIGKSLRRHVAMALRTGPTFDLQGVFDTLAESAVR